MKSFFSDYFKKRFDRLPLKIQARFFDRLKLFLKDPFHPVVKNHPLKGNLVGLRSFSVTGDYRVIFVFDGKDAVRLLDIGRHSQVYGR